MQYPQIQFYRGSLVRLASGKLKQVEDLNSDDFIESARLTCSLSNSNSTPYSSASSNNPLNFSINSNNDLNNANKNRIDENNNSVFNSPDPQHRSSFDNSPTMEIDDDIDRQQLQSQTFRQGGSTSSRNNYDEDEEEDDDDIELDVVTDGEPQTSSKLPVANPIAAHLTSLPRTHNSMTASPLQVRAANNGIRPLASSSNPQVDDFYIDSSVVRDFLEVGPPSSTSPASSTGSLHPLDASSQASTSSSTSPTSSQSMLAASSAATTQTNLTVLIKFFLESSRTIAFIEVPIEHPFFVFHRGWSSWNPQRTYDKFGLKCRKLKIGDTCISLIRRQSKQQLQTHQQQDSDQCNILFSSIKINE